jgi:hypothetical protein
VRSTECFTLSRSRISPGIDARRQNRSISLKYVLNTAQQHARVFAEQESAELTDWRPLVTWPPISRSESYKLTRNAMVSWEINRLELVAGSATANAARQKTNLGSGEGRSLDEAAGCYELLGPERSCSQV